MILLLRAGSSIQMRSSASLQHSLACCSHSLPSCLLEMNSQRATTSCLISSAFVLGPPIPTSSHRPRKLCRRRRTPTAMLSPTVRAKIPMILTYARVAAIPLLCVSGLVNPQQHILTTGLFAAASFTDFLDGYLARRWSVVSPMGTFLDPVADKLMVATALTLITARLPHPAVILSTAIIVSREIFVSALREWMAILHKSAHVKVSFWGKLKTSAQMISVTLLLFVSNLTSWYARLGLVLLAVSAALSLVSASDYIFSAARALKQP